MFVETKNLKRLNETSLFPETHDKRSKTAMMEDVSGCIGVMEVSDAVLNPARFTQSLDESIFSNYDLIRHHIFPHVKGNDLLSFRLTTCQGKNHAERLFIECLNNKTLLLKDLGFVTVDQVSAFFDKNCALITILNLTGFEQVAASDVEDILVYFTNVNEITINCSHEILLSSIFYLSKMKNLKKLEFIACFESKNIFQLEECEGKDELKSWDQYKFPKLEELNILESILPIDFFEVLKTIKHLKTLHFSSYSIPNDFSLTCPSAKKLTIDVQYCSKVSYTFPCVEELKINDLHHETFEKITLDCPALKTFSGSATDALRKFRILSSTEHLKSFTLENIESKDLSFLSNSTALEELIIGGFIEDFSDLKDLINLKRLDLLDCPNLTDISFLQSMPRIETVNLKDCFCIENIGILAQIPSLQWLALGNEDLFEITSDTNFKMIFDQYGKDQKEYT